MREDILFIGPEYAPETLRRVAVGIIGLWQMGIEDKNRIYCLLSPKHSEQFEEIMDVLLTTRNKDILLWIERLPIGVYRELCDGQRVQCNLCERLVNIVPCPRCAMRQFFAGCFKYDVSEPERAGSWAPDCVPGSPEKIELLRLRWRLGQELFQPCDIIVATNKGAGHESEKSGRSGKAIQGD
jgi:hypothetical protein